jgi:hypothetical protein
MPKESVRLATWVLVVSAVGLARASRDAKSMPPEGTSWATYLALLAFLMALIRQLRGLNPCAGTPTLCAEH